MVRQLKALLNVVFEEVHVNTPQPCRLSAYALSAGFNQLRYDFSLTELGASTTAVRCTVHCYTSPGGQGQTASPSEKLAIMMQNQDRFAIRQMKGAFEAEHTLPVC